MLIQTPQPRRGSRDPLVWDIIEYFKKYDSIPEADRWNHVSGKDLTIITNEILKCQSDYRYAAQNYFWISNKKGDDMLLSLWPGQELVLEKMEDMKSRGKRQCVLVLKARQLGMSLFGNSMVFWACVFKQNRKGMIVSQDIDQSINLFNNYLTPMYRLLPWWLKPRYSSFKLDEGIVFDVPIKEGGIGLNSSIRVQWSTRKGGMGQGYRLNAFHGSEYTGWTNLRESLEEDLKYALVDNPDTIGILESTAKGAGTPSHAFYNKALDMAERSDWETVFLPYFFETTRVLAPPQGWKLGKEEDRMVEVVLDHWVRCSNNICKRYFKRKIKSGLRDDKVCPTCGKGVLSPYTLTNEQLYYMANERENASDPRVIKQELALTEEEAFIAYGDPVFSEKAIENLEHMIAKAPTPKKGFFDKHGFFHGFDPNDLSRKCHLNGCEIQHPSEEYFLTVWDEPVPNAQYHIGVDVGYGKKKDDSVAWVNRMGTKGSPDVHVATFCCNSIEPLELAYEVAKLGKWYNSAMVAVEYNTPGNSTAEQLQKNLSYPNIYKKNPNSTSTAQGAFHWQTLINTKPKLIVTIDRWLKEGVFIVRDRRLLEQMKVFAKEEDSVKTGATLGFKDDTVMGASIALYTAHENDYHDDMGIVPTKIDKDPNLCLYKMTCGRCSKFWGSDDPKVIDRCPFCRSMILRSERNLNINALSFQDPGRDIRDNNPTPDGILASYGYDDPGVMDYSLL